MRRSRKTDGTYNERRRTWTTGAGQRIRRVHSKKQCSGRACVVHNPSDHVMRGFPTFLRIPSLFDIKPTHTERICPHGIGHPDPDDLAYFESIGERAMGVHGCDGCCQ